MRCLKGERKQCGSTRHSNRDEATLTAYFALLEAERWLFVASGVVSGHQSFAEQSSLSAIRQSIAKCLERAQPMAYRALRRSTSLTQVCAHRVDEHPQVG